jgi:Protein of unknown function DUF262
MSTRGGRKAALYCFAAEPNMTDDLAFEPDTETLDELDIEETEVPEPKEVDKIVYSISYYPSDLTLKGYLDKWLAGTLIVPKFQRNYVWDQTRASKLIESFLLGLPVPGVFLYRERQTNKQLVIDGQQRILSAIYYFRGDFQGRPFRLQSVQQRWAGKSFAELAEADQLQLQDSVLRATIIQQLDPADDSSIYHIFERLNTGGINLSPMEIRRCLNEGELLDLLIELNTNDWWRVLIGQPRTDKRLRDIELLLRVLALYEWQPRYQKPMKTFLNEFMRAFRNPAEAWLSATRERFERAVANIIQSLGPKPFHLHGRLNMAVMDSVLVAFLSDGAPTENAASERYLTLTTDEVFLEAVSRSTSDEKVVERRFSRARDILLGA